MVENQWFAKTLFIKSICILVLLSLTACSALKQKAEIKKPTVSVENVVVKSLSTKDINILVKVSIKNPNSFTLKTAGLHLDLIIDGHTLATIKQPDAAFSVDPNSKKTISLPVSLAFKNISKTVGKLSDKKSIPYAIKGNVSIAVPIIGKLTRSVSYSDTFPIPSRPRFSLGSISLESLSLKSIKLNLNFVVKNSNIFDIKLNRLNYQVNTEGKILGGGEVKSLFIAKESTHNLSIPLSINIGKVGLSVYKLLAGSGNTTMGVNIKADIAPDIPGWKPAPLQFSSQRVLNR